MTDILHAPSLRRLKGIQHGFSTAIRGHIADYKDGHSGFVPERLVTLRQVHGKKALYVKEPLENSAPEGDALITDVPGLALGVYTADCVPVLIVDPHARLIAAVHAGWRGALAGVVEASLEKMTALGADTTRCYAAMGPSIAWENYETGDDFYQVFLREDPDAMTFFKHPDDQKGGGRKSCFDLKGYVAYRLRKAGIRHLEILPYDTYSQKQKFFSYRRATHKGEQTKGRQISFILLS